MNETLQAVGPYTYGSVKILKTKKNIEYDILWIKKQYCCIFVSLNVDIIWVACFGKVDFSYYLSGKSSSLHSITVDLNRNKVKR